MQDMEVLAAKLEFHHNVKIESISEEKIVARNNMVYIQIEKLHNDERGRKYAFRMTSSVLIDLYGKDWPWAVEYYACSYGGICDDCMSNEWEYRRVLSLLTTEFKREVQL
jgi:hypothetical protein